MKKYFTSKSNPLLFSNQLFKYLKKTANSFRVRMSFLISVLAMIFVIGEALGQNYQTFDATTNAWTASKWTTSSATNSCDAGAKTSAFTSGRIAYFCTPNGTGSGSVGITIGGIIATENYTHTSPSGTLLTGGTVVTVDVASGKIFNISSPAISTAAGTGFTKVGLGAYQTGSSGNFTGGFTVNAGTMLIAGINAMGSGGALTLNGGTIAGTASRDLSGKYTGITIGGNVQFGEISTVITGANSTANLTFSNDISLGNSTRTLTLGNGGTMIFGGIISNTGSNGLTFTANSNGTGRFEITGTNTFSGPVNINGNGTGVAEVRFTSDASIGSSSNTITIDGGRLSIVSGGSVTIASSRNIAIGATLGTSISAPGATGILTYNGIIADKPSSAGILSKQGAGTLSLGGVSTYTGATSINNGTIQITTGNDRLPTTTILSLGQSASTNLGTFDLNGRNQTIAGLATTSGTATSGTNTVTSSISATLTISGSNDNVYGTSAAANNGIISGSVSIVKSGSGKQTFGGTTSYTYTGTTTINGGTLECGLTNILPATNVTLGGGALSTGVSIGFSQTVGTLSLTASTSSTIALGTGNHNLTFANSSALSPWGSSATLTITGWTGTAGASGTAGKIFVGSDATGLTSTQLTKISFAGFSGTATILSTGEIVPTALTPTITGTASATSFTTIYGTASTSQTFPVSGSNLTANLMATAPTGFEVSSDGTTYGSTATFTQSSGTASGSLRIRLAANAAVTGSYNSQNIVLSSTGATAVNITTASSGNIVSAKTLTIMGITADNKIFDGTTAATLSGTPVLNGIVSGDESDVIVGGTTTAIFAQSAIGNGIAVTVTGYTISGTKAGNYALLQPTGLTANITQAAPVVNSTLTASTTYGTLASTYTITATNSPTSFNATGLPNGLTINTTTGEITGTPTSNVTGSPFSVTISATNAGGTGTATLVYTINQKALTITTPTASDKVYDGNNSATITGMLSGIVGSDVVTLNGTGTFSQSTVATNLTVTSNSTLSGTDAGNYSLTQPTGLTANITAKNLTIIGLTANNKIYDGTTAATLDGTASLVGVITTDVSNVVLAGTPTATFAQSSAGMGIAVTVTGYTISGSATGNYSLAQPTGLTADISALGTPAINSGLTASATYGVPATTYTITATNSPTSFNATGLPAGLSINTTTGEITGTPTSVAGSPFSVIISATNISGTGTATLVYTINKKALAVSLSLGVDKVYDGNNLATITGTLTGMVGTDIVTLNGMGTFAQVNVGTNISITSTSTLAGTDAGNYSLTQPTGLSANITAKPLTITGVTANNKNYDGTTTATLSGVATATLTGIVAGDELNVILGGTPVANFAQSSVGNAITVTVVGFTISGTATGNYSLTQPMGLSANIVAVPAPVINSVLTASATYGTAASTYVITATNSPTSFNATGLPAGLNINTSTGEITGTPTSIIGSPFSVTISATNTGGTGTATLVYTINPKALTITAPLANNKVYDKTNVATISGTLNGVFGSDVVTLNGTGTFSQVNVGTSLVVTSTSTLSGTDATKYTLTQPTGLTANIAAKSLSIASPVAQNKVFDGNTNATITGILTEVISPDAVNLIGTGTFASSAVGNGIAVTSTSTLGGAEAVNYTLTQPTGLTANITAPQFSTGNLVVVNVSSTNVASLIEYTNSGNLQQIFSIPSTGTDALTLSYGATSEGALSRSPSGYYLGLAGYRTGTSGSGTDRVIVRVNSTGTVNAKSVIPNAEGHTNNNIRAAVFNDDGSRFWTSGTGTGGGVRTNVFEATSGSVQVSSTLTNTRAINIFNSQLYVSSASGTFQGLSAVGTGLPTSTGNTIAILPGFSTASGPSSYGFAINSSSTIAYVADDRATALGGIQKWTFSSGAWTLAYTLGTGVANIGTRGLTVDWTGTNPIIYATTAEATLNRIIKITDTGATSTVSTLATSSANNIFRGIAFSPTLAPTSVSLSVSSNTGTEVGTTVITVTATASSPVVGNQTVSLGVTGTNITAGDYILSNSTITIPNGSTTGSVTFTIIDDILAENSETAILTISNPSSGIILGSPITQNITITDNDNTAPTILIDVSTTSNYVDGGITVSPVGSFAVSGVINDSTDPGKTLGIDFTIGDAETTVSALTVTVSSSNLAVVPTANLALTGTGASRNLKITPAAVGYSTITISVNDGISTTSFIVNYAASAASSTPINSRYLTGKSDASTAIVIDADYMLVGDDEDQKLRLYNRNNSGLPVNSFDFSASLNLTDLSGGVPREVDIEAATRVGNSIFWMGSESNAASGNSRPNRNRIFKTDIAGTGINTTLTYVSRYDFMKDDIIAWDVNNTHGKGANYYGLANSAAANVIPESTNLDGYNIEGLEMAPNNTTAYIAFRAPQTVPNNRTKALIIPVTNFTTILSSNGGITGSATFGTPIELNLDGRGIREIRKNANNEYLIIAGASTDGIALKDFRLYAWTGNPNDAPIRLSTDLAGINADGSFESIVEVPAGLAKGSSVQLLLDSGGNVWYGDAIASKDLTQLNFQKFRAETVTLGDASLKTGTITNTTLCENSTFSVPFSINEIFANGNIFTAQLSDNTGSFLNPISIGTFTGTTANSISVTIPNGQTLGSAYRIRVVSSSPSIIGTNNGVNVSVIAKVTPTFTAVSPICAGSTLAALPTTSNNGITGSWSPALDNTSTTVYTFTPDAGQCSNSATLTITVNPKPASPTNVSVNTTICSGNGVVLSATCLAGSSPTWYENDEITPLASTNIPTLTVTSTFKVRCETTTCNSAFSSVTITVSSPLTPTIPQDVVVVPFGTSVTLQSSGCNGTVNWYNNSGILVNMPISPKCSDYYYAQCVVSSGGVACTSPSSRKVYLKITHPFEVMSIISGGNWEDASTWSGSRIPQNGDLVIIDTAHTVFIVSNSAKAQCLELRSDATLKYSNPSSKLSIGF